ncbi:MAG: GDSL-type esterase/lipase family protein [Chitinophagaceae bacterium]
MRKIILLLAIVQCTSHLRGQEKPRLWDEVQTIKAFDKMYASPKNPILFIGSSSIRKWDDVEITFAKYKVMNRGIGGAILNDIIYYANDIIFPYKPRQIVLFVGENDLPDAASTPDSILTRTKNLFALIRSRLPEVPIVYICFKPSPSREQYLPKALAATELIRNYLKPDKHTVFVDVLHAMLTKAGKPMPEYFVSDMLHMNVKGYALWEKLVQPHLMK